MSRLLTGLILTSLAFLLLLVAHGAESFIQNHESRLSIVLDYIIATSALVVSFINFLLVTGRYRPGEIPKSGSSGANDT